MENLIERASAVLRITPRRWTDLIEALPAELLVEPPLPGEWPALDCLQHLVDTERWVFPARVRCLLAGQDFSAFNPDSEGTRSGAGQSPAERAASLAREFTQLRAESLALLAGLQPGDLERRAHHAELGMVSLDELLHEWVAHDLMHTVQAERALMQPFIHGCGPWEVYFSDHIAPPKA